MVKSAVRRNPRRRPTHPGVLLAETVLPALGKLCGNGPRLWLNMQVAHDLREAEQKIDVSGIPTLEPA